MNNSIISVIVAMDDKRGIGKNQDLLFRIPEDGKRVREKTNGHPLIMGRKTFESLGRLLPNRTHIVVTRDSKSLDSLSYKPQEIVSTIQEGIEKAKNYPGADEIFIFGGGQIYAESLKQNLVDRLYLTLVKGDYNADTFFPDYSQFTKVLQKEEFTSGNYTVTFLDLEK